jgi:DNA-binding Lrp family transcriptional regulator
MEERRNQEGRFTPEHTDEEILAAVRAHEPAATSEVADEVGMTRQGADRRLRRLRDEGRVNSKKIAASLVWFAPKQDGEEGQERRDTPPEEPSGATPDDPPPVDEALDTHREAPESDRADTALEDALAGLDTTADRRDAVRACVEYLREQGTAQKSGFVDAVYPEHPAGFGSAGGWWNKIGKEYLRAVAEDVDVSAPPAGEGSHTWRYTGEA